MATYYVSAASGDDGIGDGSAGNAWKPSRCYRLGYLGRHDQGEDGTYAEDTSGLGYFNINKALAIT